jgi:thiol-disulfide isomerase/thioredoxin
LDGDGHPRAGRGRLVLPQHALLATLANSGYAAVAGDTVFFAPLSRSHVLALGPRGDTLWIARAAQVPPTPEPRFKLVGRQVRIDYQPLNLGMTLGPDGRLYLLRAVDTALREARLDVLDRASGRTTWYAKLSSPRATLAANRLGRVYALDADRLLGAIPAATREPLPAFDLPRRGGGRTSLAGLSGQVVLVNLWASWCIPCRTEMPELDTLQRSLRAEDFSFVAISEDENREAAGRFVTELQLDSPVLFGDGRLKALLHYAGLPYTLLLDRHGRIVRRWIGQLSHEDLEVIRILVHQELASASEEHHPGHLHQAPQAGGIRVRK